MIQEYTIQVYEHGILVLNPFPIGHIEALRRLVANPKCAVIDAGIASHYQATLCICRDKEAAATWRAEIDERVRRGAKEITPDMWLQGTDTGISSKTIFFVMTGRHWLNARFGPDVPHDPSDFGRCYRLLELFPAWEDRLQEVAARHVEWTPFVREWARMKKLYERDLPTGLCTELYLLMQGLKKDGYALKAKGKC